MHFGNELLQVPFAKHFGLTKWSKTKPWLHRYSNSMGYRLPGFKIKPFFGGSTLEQEYPKNYDR